MRTDPEGRIASGVTGFLAFIALNVVYLVLCLPLVTIGSATSALFQVMLHYSDDERGRPLADFFPALRENFVRGFAATALLVPAVVLAFSGVFWMSHPSPLAGAASVLAFLAAIYVFAVFLHACALIARYRNTMRQTVKNALLLPFAEPVRTLGILLLPITVVSLGIVFPPFLFVVATIGFSFGAYVAAFLFRSIFTRRSA
ncbi:putative membrane protein YesL [Microbacterium terrae]|uniref:Membrane protein YesL n=1 Tax=Microbacterium terrae TaxID=69369 RepID=A0A0M2HC31_9MICO|nr:YesL family protein [Microbacterium terrae]KJL44052.1 hypothetical protein RS81_00627 [Microbacterium terrae]MBP1079413.1 putative membrane protein YesL [Microbacterium terrae]GLJ98813.1 beta-carotene 15,15'-monooxygenase [Microbacterium terrae]